MHRPFDRRRVAGSRFLISNTQAMGEQIREQKTNRRVAPVLRGVIGKGL
jgi:hypothetical protein